MGPLGAHFPIYEMGCHHLPHKVMRNIFQHAGHAAELDKQRTLSQGSTHVWALTPPGPFLGLSPSGTQTLVLPPSGSLLPAHLGTRTAWPAHTFFCWEPTTSRPGWLRKTVPVPTAGNFLLFV